MNVIIVVFCVNIIIVNALKSTKDLKYINRVLKKWKKLHGRKSLDPDIDETNDLVEASMLIPGFYMVKPRGISRSSFKNPNEKYIEVYDRLDELNTRYAKTKAPDLNTGSRSSKLMEKILKGIDNIHNYRGREHYRFDSSEDSGSDIGIENKKLANILNAVQNIQQDRGNKKRQLIIVAKKPSHSQSTMTKNIEDYLNGKITTEDFSLIQPSEEDENNANEILDTDDNELGLRRSNKQDSDEKKCEDEESITAASGSEHEKNPGNPFTIHKNKYRQNWLWNHYMDGDHMNINPFGPQFASQGPSGPDLFFGRKWWYFNQDDYKPMG